MVGCDRKAVDVDLRSSIFPGTSANAALATKPGSGTESPDAVSAGIGIATAMKSATAARRLDRRAGFAGRTAGRANAESTVQQSAPRDVRASL
jgi:hypothetical protein